MAPGRHRPFIGVAKLAVARVVGLDLAQQKAALLQRQQAGTGVLRQHVGRQQRRDVDARLARLEGKLLCREQVAMSIATGIAGAEARPESAAIDAGVEGRAVVGIGDQGSRSARL